MYIILYVRLKFYFNDYILYQVVYDVKLDDDYINIIKRSVYEKLRIRIIIDSSIKNFLYFYQFFINVSIYSILKYFCNEVNYFDE